MTFRLVNWPRAAALFRRHGAIAALAGLAVAVLAALAALGAADRRGDAARAARQETARTVDAARAPLDRQHRGLGELARIAAAAPDAAVRQILDQMPSLAPGIRGAAIADPTGMVLLRSAVAPDETVLAELAADAARNAATQLGAAMLATPTIGTGADALVGLARPWTTADGRPGGVALVAVDATAFSGLDLVRADGSPLFAGNDTAGERRVALGEFPLMLRYSPRPAGSRGGWVFVAVAALGAAAVAGLVALLAMRLNAARREAARQAGVEQDLRKQLAAISAAADLTGELSRTKSRFFAQVTHELRTPLNAILGFSETIRQEMFGPVANARYLEYAGLIHDAGAHLLSLINDLLDNARIEAGKMEIAPIRMSAPALARSALDLVELLADSRDIAIATDGLSSCPDLRIDPRAMKQVLVNLLSNAIKYTPPGGRIELRFAARDDGGAAIEIDDTGIGMSADDLRVAFEPFGRAGTAEARRQQGTGLGLSLARALVRLHGGDLTLASRLGFGTTATVALPASAVFGLAKPAAGDVPAGAAKAAA